MPATLVCLLLSITSALSREILFYSSGSWNFWVRLMIPSLKSSCCILKCSQLEASEIAGSCLSAKFLDSQKLGMAKTELKREHQSSMLLTPHFLRGQHSPRDRVVFSVFLSKSLSGSMHCSCIHSKEYSASLIWSALHSSCSQVETFRLNKQ